MYSKYGGTGYNTPTQSVAGAFHFKCCAELVGPCQSPKQTQTNVHLGLAGFKGSYQLKANIIGQF